ncbi:uncharacterized protein LOC105261899 [Musca domestica]|uniref:Uncharacterized protein LOC105261899 n=1 Tax=Musca domestica TaxID=7370 RepID=A0A9J7D8L5_MUSDO|nr:uncharacterized protein LOC105261899 [Musca domestica]
MARRDYTIELENITPVITGIPFLKSLNFSLTNQKAANMDAMFNVKVNKLPVIASVFLLTKGKRRLNVFQMSVDICEALNNTAPNKFLSVFKDEMLRTSNIPKHCPLQENVLYSVRNYTVNDESYPPILPDATWQFEININNGNNKNLKTGIVKNYRSHSPDIKYIQ